MPYISRSRRSDLDPRIDALGSSSLTAGEINYVISRIVYQWSRYLGNYAAYNAVIGVLECVKQEFYRQVVAPYEDKKKEENGGVFR